MCQYVTQVATLKMSLTVAKTFKVIDMKSEEVQLDSNFLERYDQLEALKRNSNLLRYFDEDALADESFYLTLFRRKDWFSLIGEVQKDHPLINYKILSKISFAQVRLEVRLLIYIELRRVHGEDIFKKALILKILHLMPWQGNHAKEILELDYYDCSELHYILQDIEIQGVNYMNRFTRTRCLKEGKKCSLCYPSL